MVTVRQMERLWLARDFNRMFGLLLEMRTEESVRLRLELGRAVPAAAMAVIRLDELGQSYQTFCGKMIRVILAAQEVDGGWGEAMTTALCVRALCCSRGEGLAIHRGIAYLAAMQKAEGAWPKAPLRRMPADAFASAFILHQLIDEPRFADAVRVGEAAAWLEAQGEELDIESARLWKSVSARLQLEMACV